MGFKAAKSALIKALKNGDFQHEARGNITVKNLLATGQVTPQEVISIVERCNGSHHSCSEHHQVKGVDVHLIKYSGWYVKFYVIAPDVWFISVHQ
ncbi:hypothetical protein [Pseudomonas sp. CFII68]|uniref:hypothetical protein n=1 Tax=Pseudomonas sp. CFII68 TaxID=911243 RepID=UPI000355128C|nr:hypothetical protein [Pseudomonas sp. CFII68]EPJ84602.1 hypothetical protein CFII68_16907 [Pseudomonas sp. CFII68]